MGRTFSRIVLVIFRFNGQYDGIISELRQEFREIKHPDRTAVGARGIMICEDQDFCHIKIRVVTLTLHHQVAPNRQIIHTAAVEAGYGI